MTNEEYHADPAFSKSDLDAAAKSGKHLYDMLFGPPRESTPAFDMGTVLFMPLHYLVRTSTKLLYACLMVLRRLQKKAKPFMAEHKGKIILNLRCLCVRSNDAVNERAPVQLVACLNGGWHG